MRFLYRYFGFIMLAVCCLAFIASEHLDAPWLIGLGMAALALTGLLDGLQAIWRGWHVEVYGEYSDEANYRGFCARLFGFSLLVPALLGLLLGLMICLEWNLVSFLWAYWPALLGLCGLWLAAHGGVLVIGSEESRTNGFWQRVTSGLPLIGFVLCITGLTVAAFAFLRVNPLLLLP